MNNPLCWIIWIYTFISSTSKNIGQKQQKFESSQSIATLLSSFIADITSKNHEPKLQYLVACWEQNALVYVHIQNRDERMLVQLQGVFRALFVELLRCYVLLSKTNLPGVQYQPNVKEKQDAIQNHIIYATIRWSFSETNLYEVQYTKCIGANCINTLHLRVSYNKIC